MEITLIGNYLHDEHESMNRLAELLKGLLAGSGHCVEILRPAPIFGRLKPSSQGVGKWLGYIDKYILFPLTLRRYIRRRKKENKAGTFLVHICDQSNALYTRWLRDVPHLVNCNDVMAIQSARGLIPGRKTGMTGRLLQSWILSGLKGAANVVCISEQTRQDLISLLPDIESHSCTIQLPLNYPFVPLPREQAVSQLSTLGPSEGLNPNEDRFLIHVGGNQWYKNREGVIQIYARLCSSFPDLVRDQPIKLVMVGKPPTEAMQCLVEKERLSGKVIFLTSASDQQLCALYSLAEVMVYPSFKEGFGWPIIEAQACGCPVVTSDRPPMNHLAGPAALLADPEDHSDFALRLSQILSEEPKALSKRKTEALRHAGTFDGQTFLNEMLILYKKVVSEI